MGLSQFLTDQLTIGHKEFIACGVVRVFQVTPRQNDVIHPSQIAIHSSHDVSNEGGNKFSGAQMPPRQAQAFWIRWIDNCDAAIIDPALRGSVDQFLGDVSLGHAPSLHGSLSATPASCDDSAGHGDQLGWERRPPREQPAPLPHRAPLAGGRATAVSAFVTWGWSG